MNKFNKKFGLYLKKARINKELSQLDVAKKLSYTSAQYISNFERGLCMPPLKKIKKLIHLYKLPPNEVFNLLNKYKESELKKIILGKN